MTDEEAKQLKPGDIVYYIACGPNLPAMKQKVADIGYDKHGNVDVKIIEVDQDYMPECGVRSFTISQDFTEIAYHEHLLASLEDWYAQEFKDHQELYRTYTEAAKNTRLRETEFLRLAQLNKEKK